MTDRSLFTIDRIIANIQSLLQRRHCVLVAIDGRGGAGKSTLASELSGRLDASVAADDFYRVMDEGARWRLGPEEAYNQNFDWQRLRDQVLAPLRRNQPARYERFDWISRRLGAHAQVEPKGVVLIEGVGTYRPELRPYYHYSIYVETPRELCLTRLYDRGHNNEEWIPRWAASEDWYIQHFDPKSAVDIVVS
jgi:uridine kinase